MQFIRVLFPQRRQVYVDGGADGVTGQVLTVEEGPHRVTLGQPANYSPPVIAINPFGTSEGSPEPVRFAPAAASLALAEAPGAKPSRPSRQRKASPKGSRRVQGTKARKKLGARPARVGRKKGSKSPKKPRHRGRKKVSHR